MSRTLEERITAAHASGDKAELDRLQAEYRRTRSVMRVTLPASVGLRPSNRSGGRAQTSSRSEFPELRYTPRYTVELSSSAYGDIDQALGDTADGRETGGCLLGVTTAEGIRIEQA